MDDYRIIFYVLMGIIFVISRVMKANKSKNKAPRQSRPSQGNKPAPTSFEDILKEFGEKVEGQREEKQSLPTRETTAAKKPMPVEKTFEAGRDRRFSDEESRKIYEESIKRAEGFDIAYKVNENFKSNRTIFGEGAVKKDVHEKNPLIDSIKKDLQSPDSVKKAFILSEILNRKY